MGNVQEYIKTNPSLRLVYRFLKRTKDRWVVPIQARRALRHRKQLLYKQLHPKKEKLSPLVIEPEFVIVVLVTHVSDQLFSLIASVRSQAYEQWSLLLVPAGLDTISLSSLQEMASIESRIHIVDSRETLTLSLKSKYKKAFSIWLGEHSYLCPHTLLQLAREIADYEAEFYYADGCFLQKREFTPFYKPDYAPDTLRSMNYIGEFGVIAPALLERLDDSLIGGSLYSLWLHVIEQSSSIHHISKILFCTRTEQQVGEDEVSLQAVNAHLQRLGWSSRALACKSSLCQKLTYTGNDKPLVSIIIPNKDHIGELEPCIASILDQSTYRSFEIVVVENNSTEQETFAYYERMKKKQSSIRVVVWQGEFNYAAINNFGVAHAKGEYFLFLNNDTTVISPSWIEEMLLYSLRGDVGVVGALLYYPDDTVQHAGIVVGIDAGRQSYAEHLYRGVKRGSSGYWNSLQAVRNVSALTGACMMMSRKTFTICEGFDENFAVQFNDIDLCLKAKDRGFLNIFTPYAELYHFESKSRPLDNSSASRVAAYYSARDAFYKKWKHILDTHDPYYNVHQDFAQEESTYVFTEKRGTFQ